MKTVTMFPTKKSALLAVGSLSDTSKMPAKSWGINADHCRTGSKLAKIAGSICSTCYAQKGMYTLFKQVKRSQDVRLERFDADRAGWVAAMIKLLEKESFFRWFDSGDLQSVEMLAAIVDVVRATPHVQHWLATRERAFVKAWLAAGNEWPSNVVCRISATMFDEIPANRLTPWSSMAHKNTPNAAAWNCPAPSQGGSCGECRACWSQSVPLVTYHAH
jgi:hypothetical protein